MYRNRIFPTLLLCGAAWILPCPSAAQPIPGAGDVIIVGGNWSSNNNAIYNRIESTRISGKPLGVFGTASSTPESSGRGFVNTYTGKFGEGTAIYLDVTTSNGMADNPGMASLTASCGGFFFSGGDQSRISSAMFRSDGTRTLVLDEVWKIYLAGGCVSGSSAGAAIMSDPMIVGGTSSGALRNGFVFGDGAGVDLERGLGFFPGSQFDQHHFIRGRLGRLVVGTEGGPFNLGYGIDENTALAIDNGTGWADVLGETGAFVVDVSQMQKGANNSRWGIRLHLIQTGDRIQMVTGEMVPNPAKSPIAFKRFPTRTVASDDVWDRNEAYRLVTELVDTEGAGLARGNDGTLDVLFRQTPNTEAWRAGSSAYFITNIEMGVFPAGGNFPEPPLDSAVEILGVY